MKKLLSLFALILIFSCQKEKQQVDILVVNANVYTVNSNFDKAEAFAIKDGKFFQVGTSKDLQNTFEADTIIDAKGQAVFPGFIYAHCHFYGLKMNLQKVDLRGKNSFDEVMKSVLGYQKERQKKFIICCGLDKKNWES